MFAKHHSRQNKPSITDITRSKKKKKNNYCLLAKNNK